MARSALLRDEYIAFVESLEPNLSLMLQAGTGNVSVISFEEDCRRFLNMCRRKAHGRNWSKVAEAVSAAGFIERNASGSLHMHVAAKVQDIQLRAHMQDGRLLWQSIRHAGDYHAAPIDSVAAYSRYITKSMWSSETRENVFVYSSQPRIR